MAHSAGRHRAPGRYNPLTELSGLAAKAAEPAVKTSAVLAAAGGLVAAFAIPAQAAPAETPMEKSARQPAAAPVAVKAPEAAAPAAKSAFGVIGFTATAKPKPKPKPKPKAVRRPAPAPAAQAERQAAPQRTEQAASRSVERAPLKAATGGVLGIAAQYKGIMYKYGGTTPAGFDCSGFTQYVFNKIGISLPRTAEQQRQMATPVSNPQPGDLVFFGAPAYHMGIYAGDGKMWDSPRTGKAVDLRDIWSSSVTYGRVG